MKTVTLARLTEVIRALAPAREDQVDLVDVGAEQQERGQRRRGDRVALRQGLRRVADRVEAVGDLAGAGLGPAELGDATGVVGDRAEGVHRQDVGGRHEHAHRRDGGAEDAADVRAAGARQAGLLAQPVADQEGDGDRDRGDRGRLEADGDAADDVRGRTGLRRLGDLADRADGVPITRTMPVLELVTSSGLGSLLGMRHALEPDHLAAVSTLVTRERSGYKAALIGACWGLGHTLSLLAVGVVLLVLRAEMTTRVRTRSSSCVALMLVGLGGRAIRQAAARAPAGPTHVHQHGHVVHRHAGVPAHVHVGRWTLARRPLLVGAVHGLAGSGALTALVLTTLPTTAARITYISLFGLGSTLGMAVLSGVLGWPLARLGSNHAVATRHFAGGRLLLNRPRPRLGLSARHSIDRWS